MQKPVPSVGSHARVCCRPSQQDRVRWYRRGSTAAAGDKRPTCQAADADGTRHIQDANGRRLLALHVDLRGIAGPRRVRGPRAARFAQRRVDGHQAADRIGRTRTTRLIKTPQWRGMPLTATIIGTCKTSSRTSRGSPTTSTDTASVEAATTEVLLPRVRALASVLVPYAGEPAPYLPGVVVRRPHDRSRIERPRRSAGPTTTRAFLAFQCDRHHRRSTGGACQVRLILVIQDSYEERSRPTTASGR